ncbi:hypothetical protein [Empedobacter sp.]|uniref:hypothetical protein n=1 Tax=Empedobacter sp. TaxID=1927715 RepID=UPI00289A47C7|nr:hypothetical protein [Empedobacter sp.]
MLQKLSNEEMININGGHDGTAYNAGKAVGEAITKVGAFLGVIAYIIVPKGS